MHRKAQGERRSLCTEDYSDSDRSRKIGDVVGQRGKTINAIIEETGVKIDISDDGAVSICGVEQDAMNKALEYIKIITTDFEAGQIFVGKVVSIKEFERSLSLLLEKKAWCIFPKSQKNGSTVWRMF